MPDPQPALHVANAEAGERQTMEMALHSADKTHCARDHPATVAGEMQDQQSRSSRPQGLSSYC